MIRYVLKLWSNNTDLFAEAVRLKRERIIHGVELYNNVEPRQSGAESRTDPSHGSGARVKESLDWAALQTLKDANVITIHNPHSHGWHDFFLTDEPVSAPIAGAAPGKQQTHWEQTKELADFFSAKYIIVHPARTQTRETFFENLKKLDDTRIMVENMAGLDIDRQLMQYGVTLADLKEIHAHAPICFDLEKAVKGAAREGIPYKNFIADAIDVLQPTYFHISSGVARDAMDQHLNLWEGDIDMRWMRQTLLDYSKDKEIFLAFETPKMDGLANDVRNMVWFREL